MDIIHRNQPRIWNVTTEDNIHGNEMDEDMEIEKENENEIEKKENVKNKPEIYGNEDENDIKYDNNL